jgi:hypothetical protein
MLPAPDSVVAESKIPPPEPPPTGVVTYGGLTKPLTPLAEILPFNVSVPRTDKWMYPPPPPPE